MRLIACHIDNFGKLSNLNIKFNEGINIINESNGWGKSTLAAFLKGMFYGFDSKKEAGAPDKERKIYKPWQGGTYGGELDIEVGEKRYRISRTFGITEKGDEFHLYDLDTMLESNEFSSAIGEEIFDLDRASFKRTVFVAQNDCVTDTTDSINAKLGNLAENTNDISNVETAIAQIKDMMNKLSPSRITGSIKKRKNVITQLQQELVSFDAAEDAVAAINSKIEEKQAQMKELSAIRQEYAKALQVASEDSRRIELKKNYDALCVEVEEKSNTYSEFVSRFKDHVPSDSEISEQLQLAKAYEEQLVLVKNGRLSDDEEEELTSLDAVYGENFPDEEVIKSMKEKVANVAKVKDEHSRMEIKLSEMKSVAMLTNQQNSDMPRAVKSKFIPAGIVAIIFGMIAACASVGLKLAGLQTFPQMIIYGICGGGVLLFAVGLAFIIYGTKANKKFEMLRLHKIAEIEEQKKAKEAPIEELKAELSQIESGIEIIENEIKDFLSQYGKESEPTAYQTAIYEIKTEISDYVRLLESKKKADAAEQKCDELKTAIGNYGKIVGFQFGDNLIEDINRMQASASACRLAEATLQSAKQKKQQFEEVNDMEKITVPAECPYTLDELNNLIGDVDKRMEEVRESLQQYNRQLEDMQEQLDMRDEKELELAHSIEQQEEDIHKYDIYDTTANYLQMAKEQFTARYMAPISNGFRKYYEILTQNEEENWTVDANMKLRVKEQGELRDTQWLSRGWQDLIGVCMRFALVDAMYPEEKPFLVLDDPFVNLDDDKLARGKELLIALEKEYQAIYFTCHESREYKE